MEVSFPERALAIRRATARLCLRLGWAPLHEVRLPAADSSPTSTVSSVATVMPITQPRTVRNLVHSARSVPAKLSRLAGSGGAWGLAILCRKYWPPRLRSRRSFRCAHNTCDDKPVVSRVGSC